jgi:hypothetical protein
VGGYTNISEASIILNQSSGKQNAHISLFGKKDSDSAMDMTFVTP